MDNLMKNPLMIFFGVAVVALVGYIVYTTLWTSTPAPAQPGSGSTTASFANVSPEEVIMNEAMEVTEGFQDTASPADYMETGSELPAEAQQESAPGPVDPSQAMNQLPSECYPKDVLNSADLLPRDANSLWAQVAPNGQGALSDQNFLTAGYHIGINTVGQTLRNSNRQIRSEPPNPQNKVSPWNQTTIEPDINRRAFEIGSS